GPQAYRQITSTPLAFPLFRPAITRVIPFGPIVEATPACPMTSPYSQNPSASSLSASDTIAQSVVSSLGLLAAASIIIHELHHMDMQLIATVNFHIEEEKIKSISPDLP